MPDELKSMPKGSFVVKKTGVHPMQVQLRLFLDWGIRFKKPYQVPERAQRPVSYASKQELEQAIFRCHYAQQPESDMPPVPLKASASRGGYLMPRTSGCDRSSLRQPASVQM